MSKKCANGRVQLSAPAKTYLWACSGGYCLNPSCQIALFVDLPNVRIHFAEFAHIIAASDGGARWKSYLSPGARAADENIVLLCANCHTIIDKDEKRFPAETLHSWKRARALKFGSLMGAIRVESRQQARIEVRRLLQENRTVFDMYGPQISKQKGRQGQEAVAAWRRKVDEIIIPNSYRLLAFVDENAGLMTEAQVIEQYRQHVDDLAARHHRGIQEPFAKRFPANLEGVFFD